MAKTDFLNKVHLEGLLYQQNLKIKETGPNSKNPGTTYISGTIDIATDDECLNIVSVHYTYVPESNILYSSLMNVYEGRYKSVMVDGQDAATKVSVDGSIGLNEFYSDRTGTEELVSVKQIEGRFLRVISDSFSNSRNRFDVDMVITNTSIREADEERQLPEKMIIKGAIFDFKGSLLPVEFSAEDPAAMAYFESLEISNKNPVFTKVWGTQISKSVKRVVEEESAFGEPSIREYTSTRKDYLVTGAARDVYDWELLGTEELSKKMQDRETYLATLKQRREDYKVWKAAHERLSTDTFEF